MLKSKMYSCEIYKENDMNILHMKYAVEVAKRGSLNKAAEALLCAQPNISRSIKELENDLGITLFRRSAKGMEPTPEGAEFISAHPMAGRECGISLLRSKHLETDRRGRNTLQERRSPSAPTFCVYALRRLRSRCSHGLRRHR